MVPVWAGNNGLSKLHVTEGTGRRPWEPRREAQTDRKSAWDPPPLAIEPTPDPIRTVLKGGKSGLIQGAITSPPGPSLIILLILAGLKL